MFVEVLTTRLTDFETFTTDSINIFLNYSPTYFETIFICGALRNLAPFVQFKKREKFPWRSVNFSKATEINTRP